jgi:hypothetical protein
LLIGPRVRIPSAPPVSSLFAEKSCSSQLAWNIRRFDSPSPIQVAVESRLWRTSRTVAAKFSVRQFGGPLSGACPNRRLVIPLLVP